MSSLQATRNACASITMGALVTLGLCSAVQAGSQRMFAYQLETPGYYCEATAINAAGQVAGSFHPDPRYSYTHAFITGALGKGVIDLGTLPGHVTSQARSVNDKGQVVGYSATSSYEVWRPFIVDAGGSSMRDLGVAPGSVFGVAEAINASGQVAGWFRAVDELVYRSYLTGPDGVGVTLLGNLGGERTMAYGVNNLGQVVGQAETVYRVQRVFLTGPNGVGITQLDMGPGDTASAGVVTDDAVVAGSTSTYASYRVLRSRVVVTGAQGEGRTVLQSQGLRFQYPAGLNARGTLVGVASAPYYDHALLATIRDRDGRTEYLQHRVVNLPEGVTLRQPGGINDQGQIATAASDGHCYIVCQTEHCTAKTGTDKRP